MSPNPSQDAGGTPQPSQQSQGPTDYDDRQMIRHLASKYTAADLTRLFQEEGRTSRFPADDQASIVSYASSTLSEEPPSLFDGASIRSFSDTSSITGSIFSNVSSKLLGRKGGSSSAQAAAVAQAQVQAAHAEAAASWTDQDMPLAEPGTGSETPTSASMSTSSLAKQKTSYPCGFCREEGIVKTCTRKNDLKRHIEDFHNADAQWFCRHRGCQMVFDWQTAYKTHLKHMHGGSRMSLDEAKVNLCPQLVFACGFENCPLVFEASDDDDSVQTFKEYVSHVVKHFDEGAQTTEWSYSTRIRNLLGQSRVSESWAECGLNGTAKSQLQWHPQTSGVLRKRLECRHVGDVKLLIHYAIALGNDPMRLMKFREDFVTPFKDSCKELGPGHNGRKQLVPHEPSDPFQFRISRNANPALAAYLHSQRRVYVPNPRNRTPRPHHQQRAMLGSPPTSNPMNGGMNGSTHYFVPALPETQPSSPLYESSPQHFTPAANMMHHQAGGIVDDLRDMRSIASCSPEPDISMADTPMMTPDYSSAYTPGIQSPCGTDTLGSPVALDHQGPFYHGDLRQHTQPHAF